MGNPYAPNGPVRHSNEVRNPVDEFADRLVALGADRDDVDEWLDEVDLDDPEFQRVRRMSDAEILFHLEAVNADDVDGEMTVEDPPVEPTPPPAIEDAVDVSVPLDLLDRNVPQIVEWVEADPAVRAPVVLELESLREKPRKTLIDPLRDLADGAAE